jgi:hypothetical protein
MHCEKNDMKTIRFSYNGSKIKKPYLKKIFVVRYCRRDKHVLQKMIPGHELMEVLLLSGEWGGDFMFPVIDSPISDRLSNLGVWRVHQDSSTERSRGGTAP